jgi:hypothetical protein
MNIRVTREVSYKNALDMDIDGEVRAFLALIVFILCVECSKEPEYICEYCDKVYKQEARYRAHVVKCVDGDTPLLPPPPLPPRVCADDFAELLRQNREMMSLLQKQQTTIQLLVTQLAGSTASKMDIE